MPCISAARTTYDGALSLQRRAHWECWAGHRRDVLIFQQNGPVITCGIDADKEHILWSGTRLRAAGISVREVPRGGGVTYHGPGQIVISPLLHFLRYRRTAHLYLRALEETMALLLEKFGAEPQRIDGKSGVFVNGDKILRADAGTCHANPRGKAPMNPPRRQDRLYICR